MATNGKLLYAGGLDGCQVRFKEDCYFLHEQPQEVLDQIANLF